MASFNIPTDDNAELAGSMAEFADGRLVAIKPLARETIEVNTEYGKSPALRVQVVDVEAQANGGIRLLFWGTVQRQVLDSTTNAEWTVGAIEQQAQVGDNTRSVYLFTPPDMSLFDPSEISDAIDAAVSPF